MTVAGRPISGWTPGRPPQGRVVGAARTGGLPVFARHSPRRSASTGQLADEKGRPLDAWRPPEPHAVDASPDCGAARADVPQSLGPTLPVRRRLVRSFTFSRGGPGRSGSRLLLEAGQDASAPAAAQTASSPSSSPKAAAVEGQSSLPQGVSQDFPSHKDAPFYSARSETILEAYRPALSSHDVGKDALSAHNKYHFCVRWYRLHGRSLAPAEQQLVRASCAAYLDPIVHGFADCTLLTLCPDINRWSASELAMAAKFMSKHEVGKDKGSDGCDSWKGKDDLCFRFMFTLGYWLQKLADHDLLQYGAYEGFSSWGLSVCRRWFRQCPGEGMEVLGALAGQMKSLLVSQPVRVINTIYTMQRLGVCPWDTAVLDTWRLFQSVWAPVLQRSPQRYKDYLYGLTHFLLNESNFYQDPISIEAHIEGLAEVLTWILDHFNEHISDILALGDPDLLGEIVLCFLFTGRTVKRDWESCSQCLKVVGQCFNTDPELLGSNGAPLSYVFRKGFGPGDRARGLRMEEHTNAVCFLALGFWARRASSRLLHLYSQSGPTFTHGQWTELLASPRAA